MGSAHSGLEQGESQPTEGGERACRAPKMGPVIWGRLLLEVSVVMKSRQRGCLQCLVGEGLRQVIEVKNSC